MPLRLSIGAFEGLGQEDNVCVWIEEWRRLGIDATSQFVPEPVFFGEWSESPITRGDFDLLYYDRGRMLPGIDQEMVAFCHSRSIPSPGNPDCWNTNTLDDGKIDWWLQEAGDTLKPGARKDIYCRIARRVSHELVAEAWNGMVPNFQYSTPRLKGWTDGERFTSFGHDVENWHLAQE